MTTQLAAAGAPRTAAIPRDYQDCVCPRWVSLLHFFGMNTKYDCGPGVELFTRDGRCIYDFLSGYCVHKERQNHPYIIRTLKLEMDKCGPAMLKSHLPELPVNLRADSVPSPVGRSKTLILAAVERKSISDLSIERRASGRGSK